MVNALVDCYLTRYYHVLVYYVLYSELYIHLNIHAISSHTNWHLMIYDLSNIILGH
jgi:hypothetical protein